MFLRPLREISYNDVKDLIEVQQIEEGLKVDFKREIGTNPDKFKKELAKDMSSFANADGGHIFIGITDDKQLLGIDRVLNGRPIVEWINQVANSNITPAIFYNEPKLVEIPGSEKVIIVIEIPESNNKPHMVADEYSYYRRVNDSSKKADHYQVRDMFELSRLKKEKLNDFLKGRNLLDKSSPNFAHNSMSLKLANKYIKKQPEELPRIIFSLVPKSIDSFTSHADTNKTIEWLRNNNRCEFLDRNFEIFWIHLNEEPNIEGVVLPVYRDNKLTSYFEVMDNGYIEAGFSESMFGSFVDGQNRMVQYAHITSILGYEIALLNFAQKYYDFINYTGEVLLQISITNVMDFTLQGIYYGDENSRNFFGYRLNTRDNNLVLNEVFTTQNITRDVINAIVTKHSNKLSNAFGNTSNVGFVENTLNTRKLFEYFRL